MRIRMIGIAATLGFVIVALTVGAAGANDKPMVCRTDGAGNWTVTVQGPSLVPCPPPCDGCAPPPGDCTAVDYTITPNFGLLPDHVALLAEHDMVILYPPSNYVSAPCAGDSVTLLGFRDCSTSAVRMNQNSLTRKFDLTVQGGKDLSTSSIVVKKGKVVEECRIATLGMDTFNPNAQRTAVQVITFKGCQVTIPTDPITGEGGEAFISGGKCAFVANGAPIGTGELRINGQSVGLLTYGEGALSSGTSSCSTKVVGTKLYTFCTCAKYCSNATTKACTSNADCVSPGTCRTSDPIPPCS